MSSTGRNWLGPPVTSAKATGAPEFHLIEHTRLLPAHCPHTLSGYPGVYPGAPNQFRPVLCFLYTNIWITPTAVDR